MPPATVVHIDQSPWSAEKRARQMTGDRADYLMGGRVRIINVWRPFDYQVESYPLVLCDGSTVDKQKFIASDQIMRTYIGETIFPLYDSEATWYFLAEQRPEELVLLKIYDSSEDVRVKWCPHSSVHLDLPSSARPRRSVEVRAFVFTHPRVTRHSGEDETLYKPTCTTLSG
ncbi:hypothetical protein BDV18DRAFT_141709 [Aspergillus unguis]